MKIALVCDFALYVAYMWPKNAYFAVIVKIVCKTLFSEEIRVFYGKTMF